MQLLKSYNGAITLRDVIESHPILENTLYELHNEFTDKINSENKQKEADAIIRSLREV